jgi:8-oxo-dGTP pyrophosphatase MutT (NUDIX family)
MCNKCKIDITEMYIQPGIPSEDRKNKHLKNKRAGVIVFNSETKHLLLVQSKGKLWGFAKGYVEVNEKARQTAIRELYEETGIVVQSSQLKLPINIRNTAMYYLYDSIHIDSKNININDSIEISGIMWIRFECLKELVKSNDIPLNSHCKYILQNHFSLE